MFLSFYSFLLLFEYTFILGSIKLSVVDPNHFDLDPDPTMDPAQTSNRRRKKTFFLHFFQPKKNQVLKTIFLLFIAYDSNILTKKVI